MPEGPEIEKLVLALRKEPIWDRKIVGVEVRHKSLIKNKTPAEFLHFFKGNTFKSVVRRAKYLVFMTGSGDTFLAHQRFTGWFRIDTPTVKTIHSLKASEDEKHVRVKWHFEGGHTLSYIDGRCLAQLKVYEGADQSHIPELEGLAPDVLAPSLNTLSRERPLSIEIVQRVLRENSRKDIKTLLIDQRGLVSGLGNYLVGEVLAAARINPWKKCCDINSEELFRLYDKLYKIPQFSMQQPNYDWFIVFRRKDCKVCGGKIVRKVHKPGRKDPKLGQATYYCPSCQKVPDESLEMQSRSRQREAPPDCS